MLILEVFKEAVRGSFDFQVYSFPLDFIYLRWLHSTRIFGLFPWNNQLNIQSSSSIMIFKLSSFLTLALALSSVTAFSVPRSVDSGQLSRRFSNVRITWFNEDGVMWVFLYIMCAAMLKFDSNSNIYFDRGDCGHVNVNSDFVSCIYFSRWASIIEFSCFLRLLPCLRMYVETENGNERLWTYIYC